MASTHSTHSDDVDGGSVDTLASRKDSEQHKQELLVLEQHLSEKHQKEIQNLQTQHQAKVEEIENKYKVGRVTSLWMFYWLCIKVTNVLKNFC